MKRHSSAFTLIELLIVVAIIGVLAAIAMVNMQNAQVRARVAKVKGDFKAYETAMNSYYLDNTYFPRGNEWQLSTKQVVRRLDDLGLILLSTPISYITPALIEDPFPTTHRESHYGDTPSRTAITKSAVDQWENKWYKYTAYTAEGEITSILGDSGYSARGGEEYTNWYLLQSSGPDEIRSTLGSLDEEDDLPKFLNTLYDPTNGTHSEGNIYRPGGMPEDDKARRLFDAITRVNS